MVIRRPKPNKGGATPPKEATSTPSTAPKPKVDLIDQLVEKSLQINPSLKKGDGSVKAFVSGVEQDLQKKQSETDAPTATSTPVSSSAAPAASSADTQKKDSIRFFIEQKAEHFHQRSAELKAQERALAEQRVQLQSQTQQEITDFIALLAQSPKDPAVLEALKALRSVLESIGTTPDRIKSAVAAAKK